MKKDMSYILVWEKWRKNSRNGSRGSRTGSVWNHTEGTIYEGWFKLDGQESQKYRWNEQQGIPDGIECRRD